MDDSGSVLLNSLFDGNESGRPASELTEKIIGCAFKVSNTLGCGYLEKVYENALAHELRKASLQVEQQKRAMCSTMVFWWGISTRTWSWDR